MAIGTGPLGLLVEMFADIADDLADAFRCQQRPLGIDGGHLLVLDPRPGLDRVDIVDAERQHVLVIDGIDNGVGVQLVAKRLLCRAPPGIAAGAGIFRKDRRAGESEQVIALEHARDLGVHVAKLAAVAFVENHHDMIVIDIMLAVRGDKA